MFMYQSVGESGRPAYSASVRFQSNSRIIARDAARLVLVDSNTKGSKGVVRHEARLGSPDPEGRIR